MTAAAAQAAPERGFSMTSGFKARGMRRELRQTAGLETEATSGQPSGRHSVPPDPGSYEIRFRLTALYAFNVSFGLIWIALGILQHQRPLYERLIMVAVGAFFVLRFLIP